MKTPEELYTENMGLVLKTVYSKYSSLQEADIEDLLQEGKLALWSAACSYDESRGVKFSSYAMPYIIAAVTSCARDATNPLVYYPKSIKTVASKLLHEYSSVDEMLSDESIYSKFSMYSAQSIDGAIKFLQGTLSLSIFNKDGDDFNLLDTIRDSRADLSFRAVEDSSLFDSLFETLTETEKEVLLKLLNNEEINISDTKLIKIKFSLYKKYLEVLDLDNGN